MTDSRTVWQARVDTLLESIDETKAIIAAVGQERQRDLMHALPAADMAAGKPGSYQDEDEAYDLMLLVTQIAVSEKLLESLKAFVSAAAVFFLNKFYGTDGSDTLLNADDALRHRFIMRLLLYQAAIDLDILQQAVNQRRALAVEGDSRNEIALTLQNRSLNLADSVATMAIDPLIQAGYLPAATNVVCYLDKNIRARLVPYDDTLLIRVASTTVQLNEFTLSQASQIDDTKLIAAAKASGPARDLLALLHEVGHHLYWNGTVPGTGMPIYRTLAQKAKEAGIYHPRDWRRRWLEEIFADAYALLLGGPAVVLDFQDMLSDDLPDHFTSDTDKHPIPELRPLIQTQILRKFTDDRGRPLFTRMPDRLDEAWDQLTETNVRKRPFRIRNRKPAAGQTILNNLEGLLDGIVSVLQPLYPSVMAESIFRKPGIWSEDKLVHRQLNSLFTQFSEKTSVSNIQKAKFLEALFAAGTAAANDPEVQYYRNKFSSTPKSFAARVKELTGTTPANAPDDDWIDLFLAHGWSTEGPEGNVGGK